MRPVRWRLVLLRAALSTACALLVWQAFSLLPLADGYAIMFASPMVVTALSVPLLGEQVGWRRWTATVVGFLGVLIMIRPGFGTLTFGHGLACAAAIFGSLGFIVLRRIGPAEKSAPILFMLFGMIGSILTALGRIGSVLMTGGPARPALVARASMAIILLVYVVVAARAFAKTRRRD